MELSTHLKKNNILLKQRASNRWELISEMVDLAVKNRDIEPSDCEEIHHNLIEREKSMSTGIGNGVAIPHCTTSVVTECMMILAIVQEGMDFDSIDGQPVKIVIVLLVPKNKLSQHIKTLAGIAKLMSVIDIRKKLVSAKNQDTVIKIIRDYESKMK
jgi:fructose-specific phosphotransferase system IIA component